MCSVFLTVFDMSVTASYVIAAILLIRLLLKKAPRKYSYLLWLAAGFRLCCPFSFESALSLFSLRRAAEIRTHTQTAGVTVTQIPNVVPTVPPAAQTPSAGTEIPVTVPVTDSADPAQIAAVIWCIGMILLAGYAVFSWIRLKRSLRTALPLESGILQAQNIRSPFILGFIRPKIYIPFGLAGEQLDYVLAHERAHLKRLDHIVKPAAFLLLTVHWFNPLVWVGFMLMSRDMEMSCDEKVLGSRENIRKAYSTTLLSFAAGQNFPMPTPLAFGESSVAKRIKNILSWKKPTVWVTLAAVVITVITVFICAADPESNIDGAVSAAYQGSAVSDEARDELVSMINSSGKRVHAKNYARSADDDNIVTITCEDGSFYELHYWYNSGFSFDPRHPGEDDYCSILTKYDAEGKAERAWKMAYDFDEHFEKWMELRLKQNDETDLYPTETSYVSWQCLYMSPLSSYYPAGGDSGQRYLMDEHSFTIRSRQSGFEHIIFIDWNWQEFPYSDEEWAALQGPLGGCSLDGYSDRQFISLGRDYELFRMNGELWLAKYGSNPSGERYLWSVYSLIPENSMGSAQWEHKPYLSSVYPAFPFKFELGDLAFDEVSVFCSAGSLVDFDAVGDQTIDTLLTFPAGSSIYWSPSDPTQEILNVSGTELHFTGIKDGQNVFEGTLYITGKDSLYTAKLVGTGLVLAQSEEGGGVISLMAETVQQTGTPGGNSAYPGGTFMWRQGEEGVQLTLPEGWTGKFTSNDLGRGLSFGPADEFFRFELLYHDETPAICGTGVTFTDVPLKNGDIVTFASEEISGEISLHVFFGEGYEHYRLDGVIPAEKWEELRDELTDILETVRLGTDVPETDQGYAVTFTGKDRFSTGGDSITYRNPGSGGDAFSSNIAIRHQTEPIDPFRVEFRLPYGWSVRQPEEGDATYASMTFQPMNIYDETGNFVGTMGFNIFTAEEAEIYSGDEPDGKWGPENYTGIYWPIMTGHISWNNDITFVGDPDDGIITCQVRYDEASPLVDQTAYNCGVLAYDDELMCWTAFEIIDGAISEQELLRLAESIRFSPEKRQEEELPAPGKVPAGWNDASFGLTYHKMHGSASGTGKLCNISLALPKGWTISTPGDAAYSLPIDPVCSIHDENGNYIATIHQGSYSPVPEAEGQWNEFRAVYSDIMLGSGYSWGMAYDPVTRSVTGETALDEVYYAGWFLDAGESLTRKGILSYDSRYGQFIAIEFLAETNEDFIRSVAESLVFE